MNSSELLRIATANAMACSRLNIAIGPTGATGPIGIGPTGSVGPTGAPATKIFTLYLDYSSGTALSRIYIPPGFSTDPALVAGGIFSADIAGVLTFKGNTNITITSTTYGFPVGIMGTGYVGATAATASWQPVAGGNLGGTNIGWQITTYNTLALKGVAPTKINGGNINIRPSAGQILSENGGWLGTLTLFYL